MEPNTVARWLLTRESRRIAAAMAAVTSIAIVYAIAAPEWYESTLAVVPAGQTKSGVLGSGLAGALTSAFDIPELGVNADVERIAAVFESTSVTDAVIQKFGLMKRYEMKYVEHARRELWSHCSTKIDRKAKIVSLMCEDKDPKFVQAMLEYFGDYGNDVFRRISATSASEEVRFLERRVAETRKEANDAAQRLREFEEKYKIIDLESQSRAVVSAMASLRSQEISKELQLSYLNSFSARDESTAVQLRQQLAVMNSKFRTLEESPTTSGHANKSQDADPATNVFPAALSVPKLRFELEQLYRDKKIHETDLLLLMQRLEMAKVNEARDTSAFQILDHASLPTSKSRPHRAVAVVLALLVGAFLGVAWVYGPEQVRRALKEQ